MNDLTLEKALSIAGYGALAKTASADHEHYAFDGRDATIVSFITAQVKNASDDIKKKCADYARFWRVEDRCKEAMDKIAAYKPAQLSDNDFALVATFEGQPVRKYAAYDGDTTVKAAIAFTDHRANYPLAWRKQAAVRLLERAQRFDRPLPEYVNTYLHKAAGFGYPTQETIEASMMERMVKVSSDEMTEKLGTLMQEMIENPQLRYDEDFVKQAVATLENFDTEMGLVSSYGNGITMPEELIGNTTAELEKLSGISKLAVTLVNGRTVDVSNLSKEALEAVNPDLAKLAEDELVDVLPTLPKPDADLLVRVA